MDADVRTLWVLGTGGTIAGRAAQAHDVVGYQAGVVPVQALLQGLVCPPGWRLQAQQVANVDSKDMDRSVWQALLRAVQAALDDADVGAVVVTHGTDTMEETAWLLQAVLAPVKPVVLTGAMRPASAVVPDGPHNLADALVLATDAQALAVGGVWVTLAGRVFDAVAVRKVHPMRADAFGAGDAGPSAWVEAGQVRWCSVPQPPAAWGDDATPPRGDAAWRHAVLHAPAWPRVEWISSHADQDGAIVRALLAQRQRALAGHDDDAPLQGLVVAGTGNGSLHGRLAQALADAVAQGVQVWVTTRCAEGQVVAGHAGRARAAFTVTPLPPAKARLALALRLLATPPTG
ncbi:asparaginase [Tepidimonas aquatica]|uniref:Putative L-asparaginase n=1 Tax=Tepidimonas aquatica TaxID=247482 RepID=A0A554WPS9_9BURK|nr:asparaginase [Tepidimonas aquatica]TSE25575.1 putative L-asparaginase [Tepidimonas aquatica]